MLTLQDCIAFSGLTPEQLEAIADHQHLPIVLAAEWAETVLDTPDGCDLIEAMLVEEVAIACKQGHATAARRCRHGLNEFRAHHPTFAGTTRSAQ